MNPKIQSWITKYVQNLKTELDNIDANKIECAVNILKTAHNSSNRIYVIGNGGSASTATHIASDLSKTVKGHKGDSIWKGFKAISLSDNVSCLTAWGNDTGYENIYVGQIDNLADPDDILIAISSSGNSQNIINAINKAKEKQMKIITVSGFGGGKIAEMGDVSIVSNLHHYGPVEDIQLIINHIFTFYFYDLFEHEAKSTN